MVSAKAMARYCRMDMTAITQAFFLSDSCPAYFQKCPSFNCCSRLRLRAFLEEFQALVPRCCYIFSLWLVPRHFFKNALTSMPSSTDPWGMRVRAILEEWQCTSDKKGAAEWLLSHRGTVPCHCLGLSRLSNKAIDRWTMSWILACENE